MSMLTSNSSVAHVGETAGQIWHVLSQNGELSLAKLVKAVGEPRDAVMQGLGWLARENKISITEQGRSRTVSLRK